jgi:trehalose 6-phosphate synthase/phosphatase
LRKTSLVHTKIQDKKLKMKDEKRLVQDFKNSQKRLIFLDYDGTLVSFRSKPELAMPDDALLEMLTHLGRLPDVELVLISGRDFQTLETWFGGLPIHMAAEHGLCIKERDKDWDTIETVDDSWKLEIRPVLEMFVDRTPGSFIEEKSYSLAFHYRKTEPDLGMLRAMEIKDTLIELLANLHLFVLEGKKVLEVKHGGANKGRAAQYWLREQKWDFILAVGDDYTDEDLFDVMEAGAYTVKVGFDNTLAKYCVKDHEEVRQLLRKIIP